jgi:MFS family permease
VVVPLAAMLASQAVVSIGAQTVPVLAPELARVHGIDASNIGIYTAIVYSFAVASSMVGGGLVRRLGALRTCQVALALTAAGVAFVDLGLAGILLSAVAVGLAYGPPTPASSHVLIRVTPAHLRSLVFSLKQTGVPIGGALAGAAAPFLLLRLGLDATILVFATFCLAIALLLQPWRAELDADRQPAHSFAWRDALRPLRLVLSDAAIRRLALVSAGFAAMQIAVAAFYVAYLTQVAALSLEAAGLALSTAWISGIVGRIVWGALADASGRPGWVLVAIGLISTLGAAAATQITPVWPILAIHGLSLVLGASAFGWNGVWLAEVARLAPSGRAAEATGGAFFFTFGGAVLAPLGFRALTQAAADWTVAYWTAAAVMLLCSLLLTRGTRRS